MESQPLFEFAESLCEQARAFLLGGSRSTENGVLLSEIDSSIAELHHNLGCIGTETNQPSFTLRHFQIFNDMIIKKNEGHAKESDHWLSISWNELGNAYMMNKNWAEGEKAFLTSIETSRLQPDFKLVDVSFPYVNLGLALWLQKRDEEANETLLEGLHAREEVYGKDDKDSFM